MKDIFVLVNIIQCASHMCHAHFCPSIHLRAPNLVEASLGKGIIPAVNVAWKIWYWTDGNSAIDKMCIIYALGSEENTTNKASPEQFIEHNLIWF